MPKFLKKRYQLECELYIVNGEAKQCGTFSYAPQEPWIFSATIRQNILFGSEYDRERYNEVIRVCDLERDLDELPDGDQTILGDTGASLSGGQKARVNLARAVYKEADIYLLDDPLSAVDVHVSKKIYGSCINGFLKEKTRILVTHQVHYLRNADSIIILNEGRIVDRGTFDELADSDQVYAKLLFATSNDETSGSDVNSVQDGNLKIDHTTQKIKVSQNNLVEKNEKAEVQFTKSKIDGSLLHHYISAGMEYQDMIFLFLLMSIAQGANNCIDWFVSFWTNVEEHRNLYRDVPKYYRSWTTETYIYIYGGIVAFCLITTLSRSSLFHRFLLRCSTNLHSSVFNGVINTSLRFFHENSTGKILNRFSKDISVIDETLPRLLFDASRIFLKMVGHLTIVMYVNPYIMILVIILAFVFTHIRKIYLASSKNLKRLEAENKSSVLTHLTSTLRGLTTIRAFRAENILREEFDGHQDNHTSAWFTLISTSSAFGFALDLICLSFIGSLIFGLVISSEYFGLTGAEVGLAISQANALIGNLQFLVRFSADISNQLMSVERLSEYQLLPPEPQPVKPEILPKEWPNTGSIKINELNLRLAENGPLILKNMNLRVKGNEKVGVVGRTGAGKSSLISAIFRLVAFEGTIEIDGIDTRGITLEKLRDKISIIPQDPVLFSGTLRYNIDPFEQYSDSVLERALDEVELKDPNNSNNRLFSRVMDKGSNFSVGQRQLICLARAIVRNNKILIMDEATANVDPRTDNLIQETIRAKFASCTVLTIAHRLNTIMDSDRILVMDAGQVVEFDHPFLLLQNKEGIFHKMVNDAGTTVSEKILEIAERNYKQSCVHI